jgi:hypothetical protein
MTFKVNRQVKAIGFGMATAAIVSAIVFGPGQAYMFFMLSVVCTLGISLPFWGLMFWGLGWLGLILWRSLQRILFPGAAAQQAAETTQTAEVQGNETQADNGSATPIAAIQPATSRPSGQAAPAMTMLQTAEGQALIQYIRRNLAANVDPLRVNQRLEQQGWTVAEIESAYAALRLEEGLAGGSTGGLT